MKAHQTSKAITAQLFYLLGARRNICLRSQ